jgi:hypothetical protein
MESAKPISDAMIPEQHYENGREKVLVFRMSGPIEQNFYTGDEFLSFPKVVEFRGQLYVKNGWNSETGLVFYRTGKEIAFRR